MNLLNCFIRITLKNVSAEKVIVFTQKVAQRFIQLETWPVMAERNCF